MHYVLGNCTIVGTGEMVGLNTEHALTSVTDLKLTNLDSDNKVISI